VPVKGKVKLLVDGRYHQQAEIEIKSLDSQIDVVKVSPELSLDQALINEVAEFSQGHGKSLLLESDRVPLHLYRQFLNHVNVVSFDHKELDLFIPLRDTDPLREIFPTKKDATAESTIEKLNRIYSSTALFEKNKNPIAANHTAFFISALDTIAWLTNCRGYHLPHMSSFRAKALVFHSLVVVFVPLDCPLNVGLEEIEGVKFISGDLQSWDELIQASWFKGVKKVSFNGHSTTLADFICWQKVSAKLRLNIDDQGDGLISVQSIKTETEIELFKQAFERSDRAIYNTIGWVREMMSNQQNVSEWDFCQQANQFYRDESAVAQSFKTISAIGDHSSIIHFNQPEKNRLAQKNDLMLLDSGAYYESGFATDCTRTFLASDQGEANSQQKLIYTLVLKGLLAASHAIVPVGTMGCVVDGMARAPIYQYGFNYQHGTGHGVGVHVHEPGVRIHTSSLLPLRPGQVVSIEPGIYLPGFGGVRIENIYVVRSHPEFSSYIYFESLVYIGLDHHLIEKSLLSSIELKQLDQYEKACQKKQRSFL
jgi:Xaa-Pro aminopeptidase